VKATSADWFTVDREGLAKLLARKGKEFVIYELLQNAWDTGATQVDAILRPVEGRPLAELRVEDNDPDGFQDLAHAWTLFAESQKKGDPEKRGRFNLGEKLVLALCTEAVITTTTGCVIFTQQDGRRRGRSRREKGSEFFATIRVTREEYEGILRAVKSLLPPKGVVTTFNGAPLLYREPVARVDLQLPTEISDAEGILRRTSRKTWVEVYEPLPGETASIYELGIPVVETGDRWHYNVGQKVPLNVDRDNVTPSYLQELRTAVLNAMHSRISKEDAATSWVRDASADPSAAPAAIETVMTHRFGVKRVIADPTDPEGTKLAMSQGYTVVPGGALSGGEWANVKRDQVMLPAGQVTPSPKPYSPDGDSLKIVPPEKYTAGMVRIVDYARALARELMGVSITIQVVTDVTWPYAATYGPGHLTFNLGRLGHAWFDAITGVSVDKLLIHEFGHHYSADHLSEAYHDALCELGAKMAALALSLPEFFRRHGRTTGGVR
jgi:hypothetical protein